MEGYGVCTDEVEAVDDPADESSLVFDVDAEYGFNLISDKKKEDAVFFWRKGKSLDCNKENNPPLNRRGTLKDGKKVNRRKNRKFSAVQSKYKYVKQVFKCIFIAEKAKLFFILISLYFHAVLSEYYFPTLFLTLTESNPIVHWSNRLYVSAVQIKVDGFQHKK